MKEVTNVLEDNDIEMDIACRGGRGEKKQLKYLLPDIYDMTGSNRM